MGEMKEIEAEVKGVRKAAIEVVEITRAFSLVHVTMGCRGRREISVCAYAFLAAGRALRGPARPSSAPPPPLFLGPPLSAASRILAQVMKQSATGLSNHSLIGAS
jgi:hypothetical protein